MAIVKTISPKIKTQGHLSEALAYITKDEKASDCYYHNCVNDTDIEAVAKEFQSTRIMLCQDKGIIASHICQSFSPDDKVTPEIAHEIGKQMIERCFPDYQVVLATHKDSYMSVFLHEAAHASGAAHRLNRDLTGSFGSESYAKEELRAEIASAFTASATGINYEQAPQMENHTAYVQNWISVLQNNPNELFRAIKDATKISDYLIEKGEFVISEDLTESKSSESDVTVIDPEKFNDMLQGAKPKYKYWEVTRDEYVKLHQAGFQNMDDYRQSTSHPDKIIFRFEESKAAEVNAVLKPTAAKMIKA